MLDVACMLYFPVICAFSHNIGSMLYFLVLSLSLSHSCVCVSASQNLAMAFPPSSPSRERVPPPLLLCSFRLSDTQKFVLCNFGLYRLWSSVFLNYLKHYRWHWRIWLPNGAMEIIDRKNFLQIVSKQNMLNPGWRKNWKMLHIRIFYVIFNFYFLPNFL